MEVYLWQGSSGSRSPRRHWDAERRRAMEATLQYCRGEKDLVTRMKTPPSGSIPESHQAAHGFVDNVLVDGSGPTTANLLWLGH